eukprot:gene3802-4383_t
MEPVILEEVQRLVDVLDNSVKTGEPLEINGFVKRTTLNIILTILFGIHYPQSVNDKESLDILEMIHKNFLNHTIAFMHDYIPFLRPLLKGRPKYFYKDWSNLKTWVESIVNKRIETFDINAEPKDILDDMLIHHHNGDITIPAIASSCLDMVFGGSDTSLIEELRSVYQGNTVSAKDRSLTPFANATIKESLRRHPVVPLGVPHQVNEDVMFSGYLIKKGSQIIQNIYASCLSPKIWEDPLTFNPARFLGENNPNTNKYRMVFGSGPRNCIAMSLAENELYLVICTLFSRFTFTSGTGGLLCEEDVFGLTLSPHPFKVKVSYNNNLNL